MKCNYCGHDIMKCKYCGYDMRLDDTDFQFKGCMDKHWECDNCPGGAIEKIRYGKTVKIEFYKGDK